MQSRTNGLDGYLIFCDKHARDENFNLNPTLCHQSRNPGSCEVDCSTWPSTGSFDKVGQVDTHSTKLSIIVLLISSFVSKNFLLLIFYLSAVHNLSCYFYEYKYFLQMNIIKIFCPVLCVHLMQKSFLNQ